MPPSARRPELYKACSVGQKAREAVHSGAHHQDAHLLFTEKPGEQLRKRDTHGDRLSGVLCSVFLPAWATVNCDGWACNLQLWGAETRGSRRPSC